MAAISEEVGMNRSGIAWRMGWYGERTNLLWGTDTGH